MEQCSQRLIAGNFIFSGARSLDALPACVCRYTRVKGIAGCPRRRFERAIAFSELMHLEASKPSRRDHQEAQTSEQSRKDTVALKMP
ncbi:MAG: hypothetical protein ACLQHF_05995 [Terracidiphilus sp.]